jgi:hypothetical protein
MNIENYSMQTVASLLFLIVNITKLKSMLLGAANISLRSRIRSRNCPPFFGTQSFITVFRKTATRPCHQIVEFNPYIYMRNRDSSVGIAASYGMNGLGSITGRHKTFLLPTASRQVQGSHPASYRVGTWVDFFGYKAAGA